MLQPDLIVAGSFTTTTAVALLRKLGYEVITFDPENNLEDMRANVRKMGRLVGEEAKAEQVIAEFDAKLAGHPGPDAAGRAPGVRRHCGEQLHRRQGYVLRSKW